MAAMPRRPMLRTAPHHRRPSSAGIAMRILAAQRRRQARSSIDVGGGCVGSRCSRSRILPPAVDLDQDHGGRVPGDRAVGFRRVGRDRESPRPRSRVDRPMSEPGIACSVRSARGLCRTATVSAILPPARRAACASDSAKFAACFERRPSAASAARAGRPPPRSATGPGDSERLSAASRAHASGRRCVKAVSAEAPGDGGEIDRLQARRHIRDCRGRPSAPI